MIALLKKDYFSPRVKIVLSYVPSAVFPAIIFPAVFLNSTGQLVFLDNPKVLAALTAVLVGYLTESVIATILSGLGVFVVVNLFLFNLMLRAIFVIFFFQLLGEALKKFFEMRIPGPGYRTYSSSYYINIFKTI
jgi:branched-subunit amino acid transport protein